MHASQLARGLLWAASGLLLLPLLLIQGRRARRDTPRLPEATGSTTGVSGADATFRLSVIGESPVAGVGVATYEEALAAQLARCLAARLGRDVQWTALGENGADAAGVLERLAPRLSQSDAVVICMGVNDTTRFTSLARWRERMARLIGVAQRRCTGTVFVAGVPPMGKFTALPQPLRAWIGLRAALLDAELRRCAPAAGAQHVEVPALLEPQHLAPDGYHPSAAGSAAWAEHLAAVIRARGLPPGRE
jgi:lysophospholipase L1-like esterase